MKKNNSNVDIKLNINVKYCLVTLLFIFLKIFNIVNWSWWFLIVVFVIDIVFNFLLEKMKRNKE